MEMAGKATDIEGLKKGDKSKRHEVRINTGPQRANTAAQSLRRWTRVRHTRLTPHSLTQFIKFNLPSAVIGRRPRTASGGPGAAAPPHTRSGAAEPQDRKHRGTKNRSETGEFVTFGWIDTSEL